jgi:hypothetical protein
MRTKLPPLKQRQLNAIHGDWYDFLLEQRRAGQKLEAVAIYFTMVDRVPVHFTTLYRWVRYRQDGKYAAGASDLPSAG